MANRSADESVRRGDGGVHSRVEVAMPEGPLEFAADTPRPHDGARFDIYADPHDRNRGRMIPNDLTGRYVVVSTDYAELDGTTYLRLWYDPVPSASEP
jgi:hypothetical protein